MSAQFRKSRLRRSPSVGVKRLFIDGIERDKSTVTTFESEYQQTFSQGNPVSRIGKGEDIGGFFQTSNMHFVPGSFPVDIHTSGGSIVYSYKGPISAFNVDYPVGASGLLVPSTKSQMDAYGTQAIRRCLPTNPIADMGQFLGELRDLPRVPDIKSWQTKLRNFHQETKRYNFDRLSRSAGDEVLNGLFGWSPFISDLMKFAKVVRTSSELMTRYARGSNHLIHRQYRFPTDSETKTFNMGAFQGVPAQVSYLNVKQGQLTRTERTTTNRWFSGAFTYYLPPVIPSDNEFVQAINKWRNATAQANRLFGLRLTPSLLYKLTPWSWALDWVSTTGDVIHNWSAFSNDSLVMRYGYIMEHKTSDVIWALNGAEFKGAIVSTTDVLRRETKVRQRATPYGFGVNQSSFSAKQWAVIAALGISRQPLSLNF